MKKTAINSNQKAVQQNLQKSNTPSNFKSDQATKIKESEKSNKKFSEEIKSLDQKIKLNTEEKASTSANSLNSKQLNFNNVIKNSQFSNKQQNNQQSNQQQHQVGSPVIATVSQKKRGSVLKLNSDEEILEDQKQYINYDIQFEDSIDEKDKTPCMSQKKGSESTPQNKLSQAFKISNYYSESRPGSVPSMPIKQNQDSMLCQINTNSEILGYFSVMDGHGENGHHVSQYVKANITKNFQYYYQKKEFNFSTCIKKCFKRTDQMLKKKLEIEIQNSGSTTVFIALYKNIIYCGNVGDSRAILVSQKNNQWSCTPLSRDLKPDQEDEKQRILKAGGVVQPFIDEDGNFNGPARIWYKDRYYPGLAMSRAFGDLAARQIGLISEPEIKTAEYTGDEKFIFLASDGVWEFLKNEQIMNMIIPYYLKNDPKTAIQQIIQKSVEEWRNDDIVVDDITCILIFLQ